MSPALELVPHTARLQDLLASFPAQEDLMAAELRELETELERCHREATGRRLDGHADAGPLLRHVRELQVECDALANDLVHVRMAIQGAVEELGDRRRSRAPLGFCVRQRVGA